MQATTSTHRFGFNRVTGSVAAVGITAAFVAGIIGGAVGQAALDDTQSATSASASQAVVRPKAYDNPGQGEGSLANTSADSALIEAAPDRRYGRRLAGPRSPDIDTTRRSVNLAPQGDERVAVHPGPRARHSHRPALSGDERVARRRCSTDCTGSDPRHKLITPSHPRPVERPAYQGVPPCLISVDMMPLDSRPHRMSQMNVSKRAVFRYIVLRATPACWARSASERP